MTSISAISSISSSQSVQFSGVQRPERSPRQGGQDPLQSVAKALSLSADELKSQLRDGKSLSDVAEAQGVSHDDLIAAIKAGKPSDAPANPGGVSDDEMAEKIADRQGMPGRGQGGPGGPGGPGGGPGGPAGLRDDSKVKQLSTLLDSDTGDLSQLSAAELVKKFQSQGVGLDKLTSVFNNGDLLNTYA
ncbi:hypothetical protein ABT369_06995 [Dactylosporangium sp. NPDC000244]|uniref:hypothetical protein n=1 Tax=Dactylosporangium sp. NPDC000244 TaxID=3154365 RepID=UPI003330DCE3